MAALAKDSSIIILRATDDGYFASVYQWDQSPPPVNIGNRLDLTNPAASVRTDRVATDKTELKNEINAYIDTLFDV
jgi:hypothetical protein